MFGGLVDLVGQESRTIGALLRLLFEAQGSAAFDNDGNRTGRLDESAKTDRSTDIGTGMPERSAS